MVPPRARCRPTERRSGGAFDIDRSGASGGCRRARRRGWRSTRSRRWNCRRTCSRPYLATLGSRAVVAPRPPAPASLDGRAVRRWTRWMSTPSPDAVGAATLEFRSPTPYPGAGHPGARTGGLRRRSGQHGADVRHRDNGGVVRPAGLLRPGAVGVPPIADAASRRSEARRAHGAAAARVGGHAAARGSVRQSGFDAPPLAHAAPSHQSVREFFSELALRQPKVRAEAPASAPG